MGVATMANKKDPICDIHGPCQTIQSTLKLVFRRFRLIGYAYKLLRYLDVEIWRFFVVTTTERQTDKPITLSLRMRTG